MTQRACALCQQGDADATPDARPVDATNFKCPRCGTYSISFQAEVRLKDPDPELRRGLIWAARRASDLGSPLRLSQQNLEEIAGSVVEPHPPRRKVDELILLLGRRAPVLTERVPLYDRIAWPLVYARSEQEFAAIRQIAGEEGYLNSTNQGFRLTTKGWERFAQLEAERPRSTQAFVAMRFNDELKSAYDEGFYRALHDLGYDPIRVDREHYNGKIDDFIVASIRKSALLVADCTEFRSGVFFEAGLALGLGLHVIWTCREGQSEEIGKHFDTRQYNHLLWSTPADLYGKLRLRIEATVTGRPRPRS